MSEWNHEPVDRALVRIRVQGSLGLTELESVSLPDVVWVHRRSYRGIRPNATDILLAIEVADRSLNYDRGTKARLHAEAGITDDWVANWRDSSIEIFRGPEEGRDQSHEIYERGRTVRPLKSFKIKSVLNFSPLGLPQWLAGFSPHWACPSGSRVFALLAFVENLCRAKTRKPPAQGRWGN